MMDRDIAWTNRQSHSESEAGDEGLLFWTLIVVCEHP